MENLIKQISNCTVCKSFLPNLPKPVVSASVDSRIIIIGQAPGQKVQNSGIPWDDQSGDELRRWLGVDKIQFYDTKLFALIPMGFCFPGSSSTGDFPPRIECAPLWHERLFRKIKKVKLTLLVGQYAQKYYLKEKSKRNLTQNVKNFHEFLPGYLPLVHPSPRNRIWQKKNPWFESDVVPQLRKIVSKHI